ncbi:MAG: hypothetical protein E7574_02085 [Ruminococcaceae bacterium]|nr:hypothetical protein [Oscillospiraceae bacterium]
MGFGYLFLGYLFLFSFPYKGLDITIDIIGFIIAYLGLRTLSEYGCGFNNLKKYVLLLLPVSTLTLTLQLINYFGVKVVFLSIWNYIYTAFLLVYNVMLLVSVYKIATSTEMTSIQAKAQRNLVICLLYYFAILFFETPFPGIQTLENYLIEKFAFGLIIYLLGYIWMILNASLLFSCYMWICKEGDEDMPEKQNKKNKAKED